MTRLAVVCLCAAACARTAGAATLTVNAGGDLQAALNAAKPGDTIVLQAGATFTGNYKLPAKGGTSYITIRSSTPDSALPADGTRITPAAAPLLAKIKSNQNGSALRTIGAAGYWRLLFLEFAPAVSNASADLVELGAADATQSTLASVPQHLIVDRCYFHGEPTWSQRRGLALNSGDTQVINSYFSEIHGVNEDTQAIAGWNGPGPYLIENNYIEAAGENIMFGGSDPNIPNLVPDTITLRGNDITKQVAWRTATWTVKNLVEFKNAENVLVEGNTIENNWLAGQQGYSILMTPRNQSGGAPWTVVKNVTVQNNVIRHVAAVFDIAGYDDLQTSEQTSGIVIRNNLAYDVNTSWGSSKSPAPARFAEIGGGPKDITIDHNTIDSNGSSTIFIYGGYSLTGVQIASFTVTNNLLRDNAYAIFGDKYGEGTAGLTQYAPGADVRGNAFGGGQAKLYPTGNDFPTLAQWLADFVNVAGADYRLVSTSLSKHAATDGADIGVDFTALDAAMSGASGSTSTPPSTPAPMTVQFEDYDGGGQGVGYSDTTSGNSGGAYRNNWVDIQATTDTGGGYDVGWVKATEWLDFTVTVPQAGSYTIDVRVASSGAGGTFHITSNGVNVTGTLTVPNTGGWQNWTTITKTGVTLPAGQQVLRVVMDTNGPGGSVGNFNWFSIR
ncbi:MAG TPA: carbohydrate-binding protein [Vicinamibacterales bacterium]|nr:carbohydrate-binding protein [Vicinamibacterales bacterium]